MRAATGRGVSGMSASTKKPTPEEKDQEELREVEAKIKEVVELMTERHSRERVDESLAVAREKRDQHNGDTTRTFRFLGKRKNIETTVHTRAHMELADVLKTRIQLGQYAADLEDSLRRLSERHVEILERILSRSRY